MKATEQYFPVVLLIMLYKAKLTFEPVNHSNESYHVVLFVARYVAKWILKFLFLLSLF